MSTICSYALPILLASVALIGLGVACQGGSNIFDWDEDGSIDGEDCSPMDPLIRPGLSDPWGDGVDQNCDGVDGLSVDQDRDGYAKGVDCDDLNSNVHPQADDPDGDGRDTNCDGVDGVAEDADADGYSTADDCNDEDPNTNPGAEDAAGDSIDADCDGIDGVGADADADGHPEGVDCDDNDPNRHPGATDVYGDGIDHDCDGSDGLLADNDGDGYTFLVDCDDAEVSVHPNAEDAEDGDGVDQDCDGIDSPNCSDLFFTDIEGTSDSIPYEFTSTGGTQSAWGYRSDLQAVSGTRALYYGHLGTETDDYGQSGGSIFTAITLDDEPTGPLVFSFWIWMDVDDGIPSDTLIGYIEDGDGLREVWSKPSYDFSASRTWQEQRVGLGTNLSDLDPDTAGQQILFKWHFEADDEDNPGDGIFIDDIRFEDCPSS